MTKAVSSLPEGYREIYSLDLQKDRKKAVLINILAVGICLLMLLPVFSRYLSSMTASNCDENGSSVGRLIAFAGLSIGYILLHELVHGIAMKLFGTKKIKYGFTGMYAFAASDDYYPKIPYICIALAPIAVWGIVLAVALFLVPVEWFWIVYSIQLFNMSGAAGDLYVTVRFLSMPKDILVRDYGVAMTVYSAQGAD